MNIPVEVGRICRSKSGRDKGRYFVILDRAEGDYVYIVDGMLRKMAKPKRKKLKHLELTHDKAEAIASKFLEGKKVFDPEIHSALRNLGYGKKGEDQ